MFAITILRDDYNWWHRNFNSNSPWTHSTIEDTFSESLSSSTSKSFLDLAKKSQLESDNVAFDYWATRYGDPVIKFGACHVGPRDSIEAYKFSVIGIPNGAICFKDLVSKLVPSPSLSPDPVCGCSLSHKPLDDLLTLVKYLNSSATTNQWYKNLSEFGKLEKYLTSQPEYQELNKLDNDFKKMDDIERVKFASQMQSKGTRLRDVLYKRIIGKFGKLLDQYWEQAIDALFYKSATVGEKTELERRKQCLSEPVF